MDNPTQIVPQANELVHGYTVDSYAQKYGIPTDVFRNVIQTASNFDPNYVNSETGARGIAALNFSKDSNINPDDIGSSLDFIGNALKSLYSSTGSWSAAQNILTTPDPGQVDAVKAAAADDPNSWSNKIANFFKSAGYSILISAVGVLLILGSVWVILNSSENK